MLKLAIRSGLTQSILKTMMNCPGLLDKIIFSDRDLPDFFIFKKLITLINILKTNT